jgi:hypothetical protein
LLPENIQRILAQIRPNRPEYRLKKDNAESVYPFAFEEYDYTRYFRGNVFKTRPQIDSLAIEIKVDLTLVYLDVLNVVAQVGIRAQFAVYHARRETSDLPILHASASQKRQ